ncbi:hypothetical protein [Jeongeupia chitinilytica]|uniref:Uncharacterized protein n=1 Tax=Jeongeupia chitinilytica TaxID=1041641 RepID=A0ABQ3H2P0_9NEIS|nr:hypothetical protein [Jeongeupia chitinilytica]GHD67227.1 hypothetical protein GCM10007350_30700 [Jeongeupia chitinilytica]
MPFNFHNSDRDLAPGALARMLSDREAGTARQWYWLEIAATLPKGDGRSGDATPWPGRLAPLWAWPWLRASRLPGVGLYAAVCEAAWQTARDKAAGGALYAAIAPALLSGLGLLPASQAFAVWLILLSGLLAAPWRIRPAPATADPLPGPEECTGLAGLLLASDCPPDRALALVAALRADPDAAWPELLQHLPQLAPPVPTRQQLAGLRATGWLAGTLPAALLISVLPAPWGLPAAVLAGAALNTRLIGRRAGLVTAGSAALVYGLGAAVHLL